MGTVVLTLVLGTFLAGTLIGHGMHWVMHQRWSGRLFRAHMTHHMTKYPPANMLSKGSYRGSGLDSGWLFFTPPVTALTLVFVAVSRALGLPTWMQVVAVGEVVLLGLLHGYVHDALHIKGHWMERLWGFKRLRKLHAIHHLAMRRNLGVLWFGWDRVFGTFRQFNRVHRRP